MCIRDRTNVIDIIHTSSSTATHTGFQQQVCDTMVAKQDWWLACSRNYLDIWLSTSCFSFARGRHIRRLSLDFIKLSTESELKVSFAATCAFGWKSPIVPLNAFCIKGVVQTFCGFDFSVFFYGWLLSRLHMLQITSPCSTASNIFACNVDQSCSTYSLIAFGWSMDQQK